MRRDSQSRAVCTSPFDRPYASATQDAVSPASIMPEMVRVGMRVPLRQGAPNCRRGSRTTPNTGSHVSALWTSLNVRPWIEIRYSRSKSRPICPCRDTDMSLEQNSAKTSPCPVHTVSVANGRRARVIERNNCSAVYMAGHETLAALRAAMTLIEIKSSKAMRRSLPWIRRRSGDARPCLIHRVRFVELTG